MEFNFREARGIVAASGERNVVPLVEFLLKLMSYRSRGIAHIITQRGCVELELGSSQGLSANVAVGFFPVSASEDGGLFAVHGTVYPPEESVIFGQKLLGLRGDDPFDWFEALDSDCVYGGIFEGDLLIGRSFPGTKPLFYTKFNGTTIFSSDRKPLSRLNPEVLALPPGIYRIPPFRRVRDLTIRIEEKEADMDTAVEVLRALLAASIRNRVSKFREVAVGFSGGLDSSLIAKLSSFVKRTVLFSTSVKGSYDDKVSARAAELLGLEHVKVVVGRPEIESAVKRVKELLCTTSLMDLSIATLLYLLAKSIRENGFDHVLLGQSADELFAGYERHLRIVKKDLFELRKTLQEDLDKLWSRDFPRDELSCSLFLEPLFPFASPPLVKYAASLPLRLKIEPRKDVRKLVLRELARKIGLPTEIVNRPKKALQYSSGVQKIVSEII